MTDTCALCDGPAADAELGRTLVWEDDLWRLSMSVRGHNTVAGFSFLEPKRHIPHITDLDGEEARTFGTAIARCTAVLKEATGAELVFVYVFGGGIPHLHVHLAPHTTGDSLNTALIKGEFDSRPLPSGATEMISKDYPALPEAELQACADRAAALLSGRS